MERGFSADFAKVKVHDNDHAARFAQQVRARAFTVGNDVFFNRGEFRPRNHEGQQLVAHELAHVVQQGRASPTTIRRFASTDGGSDLRVARKPSYEMSGQAPSADRMALDHGGKMMGASLLAAVDSGAQILNVFFNMLQELLARGEHLMLGVAGPD